MRRHQNNSRSGYDGGGQYCDRSDESDLLATSLCCQCHLHLIPLDSPTALVVMVPKLKEVSLLTRANGQYGSSKIGCNRLIFVTQPKSDVNPAPPASMPATANRCPITQTMPSTLVAVMVAMVVLAKARLVAVVV